MLDSILSLISLCVSDRRYLLTAAIKVLTDAIGALFLLLTPYLGGTVRSSPELVHDASANTHTHHPSPIRTLLTNPDPFTIQSPAHRGPHYKTHTPSVLVVVTCAILNTHPFFLVPDSIPPPHQIARKPTTSARRHLLRALATGPRLVRGRRRAGGNEKARPAGPVAHASPPPLRRGAYVPPVTAAVVDAAASASRIPTTPDEYAHMLQDAYKRRAEAGARAQQPNKLSGAGRPAAVGPVPPPAILYATSAAAPGMAAAGAGCSSGCRAGRGRDMWPPGPPTANPSWTSPTTTRARRRRRCRETPTTRRTSAGSSWRGTRPPASGGRRRRTWWTRMRARWASSRRRWRG